MPFPIIPVAFEAGRALMGILGSENQQDPSEVYQQRLEQALNAVRGYFTQEEIGLKQDARTDTARAQIRGAREKAATGYTGSVSAFTAPAEGSIAERLQRSIQQLKAQKARSVSDIRIAEAQAPFYQKPNTFDYLGAGLGAAGQIYAANTAGENALKLEQMRTQGLKEAMQGSLSSFMGKGGQTPFDGDVNRLMTPNFGSGESSFTPERMATDMFYPGLKNRNSFDLFFPEGR